MEYKSNEIASLLKRIYANNTHINLSEGLETYGIGIHWQLEIPSFNGDTCEIS